MYIPNDYFFENRAYRNIGRYGVRNGYFGVEFTDTNDYLLFPTIYFGMWV